MPVFSKKKAFKNDKFQGKVQIYMILKPSENTPEKNDTKTSGLSFRMIQNY